MRIFIFTILILFPAVASLAEAQPELNDSWVASFLAKGEGGIILGYKPYITKKGYKHDPNKHFESLEQIISEVMMPAKHPKDNLMILTPDNLNEETRLAPERINGSFVYIYVGKPGDYVITRLTQATISKRIYGKVAVESGKIKYLGDIYSLSVRPKLFQLLKDSSFDFRYKPEEFDVWFKSNYQRSAPYLINEELQMIKEDVIAPTPLQPTSNQMTSPNFNTTRGSGKLALNYV